MLDIKFLPHQAVYLRSVFSVLSSGIVMTAAGSYFNLNSFLTFIGIVVGSVMVSMATEYRTKWIGFVVSSFFTGSALYALVEHLKHTNLLQPALLAAATASTAIMVAGFVTTNAFRAMVITCMMTFSSYLSLFYLTNMFIGSSKIQAITFFGSALMTSGSLFIHAASLYEVTKDKAYCVDPVRDALRLYEQMVRVFVYVAKILIDLNDNKKKAEQERRRR